MKLSYLTVLILFLSVNCMSAPLSNNLKNFAILKLIKSKDINFSICSASVLDGDTYVSYRLSKKSETPQVNKQLDLKLSEEQTKVLNKLLTDLVDENGQQIHKNISDINGKDIGSFQTQGNDNPPIGYSGGLSSKAFEAASFLKGLCALLEK